MEKYFLLLKKLQKDELTSKDYCISQSESEYGFWWKVFAKVSTKFKDLAGKDYSIKWPFGMITIIIVIFCIVISAWKVCIKISDQRVLLPQEWMELLGLQNRQVDQVQV